MNVPTRSSIFVSGHQCKRWLFSIASQIIPIKKELRIQKSVMPNIPLEQLLGREEILLDMNGISNALANKVILITGAGGSIGAEISRQVAALNPRQLLLLGHGENSIYDIHSELVQIYGSELDIIPIIADVQDRSRMFEIMTQFQPSIIYHAAAHKHVPLMESHPFEAVKNNIFGTKNVAEAADQCMVGQFVLVSTDKAVNPSNIMGATKRIAEMIIQSLAVKSSTKFTAVRFGNVLGSRGSVIPRFQQQLALGGPITVTHPEMTRYFMTIAESAKLVLHAGCLAKGGEIFVLNMGEPKKIVDLAKNLIRLCGYSEEDIGIEFSGIRPGEKMFEELLNAAEIQHEYFDPHIHIGRATCPNEVQLAAFLSKLEFLEPHVLREKLLDMANSRQLEQPLPSLNALKKAY